MSNTRSYNSVILIAVLAFLVGGGGAYFFLRGELNSPNAAAVPKSKKDSEIKRSALAEAALESIQNLLYKIEAGINYRDYSSEVSNIAVLVKKFLATPESSENKNLYNNINDSLQYFIVARDIWEMKIHAGIPYVLFDIKDNEKEIRQNINANFPSSAVLDIYPKLIDLAISNKGNNLKYETVLQAVWEDARNSYNLAKNANGVSN